MIGEKVVRHILLALLLGTTLKGLVLYRDLARLERWTQQTCAFTGEPFTEKGAECQQRVEDLARFERDARDASSEAQGEDLDEQRKKAGVDLDAARKTAKELTDAAKKMEKANAAVQNDRVGTDWFGALNELGGLRRPAEDPS